jgi:hypothetical protein
LALRGVAVTGRGDACLGVGRSLRVQVLESPGLEPMPFID